MSETIESVRARRIELPLNQVFITSRKRYESLIYCIVEASTRSGLAGYGETREVTQITGEVAESILAVINRRLGPALAGLDPFDLERAHQAMDRACCGNTAAKSAVDMALHDLMGRIAGLPLCKLLGGRSRDRVETSKAVGLGPLDQTLAEARALADQGYRTLKLKTGLDPKAEIRMIRAVREAVGPEILLKLDANQGWTLREAVRVIAAVEEVGIEVVEQPLPAWDLKGSAELRRLVAPPIMLDEGVHSPHDAIRIIEAGAADMLNLKLAKTGGIYPALDIIGIAQAAGLVCQIGSLDTSIGTAAGAHLALARTNIAYAELNGPTRLRQDTARGLTMGQGTVSVSDKAGLGLDVDLSALN